MVATLTAAATAATFATAAVPTVSADAPANDVAPALSDADASAQAALRSRDLTSSFTIAQAVPPADLEAQAAAARRLQGMYRRRTQGAFTKSMANMRSLWDKKLFENLPIVRQLHSSKQEMEKARTGQLGCGLTHWKKLHTVVAATTAFRANDKYKIHSAQSHTHAHVVFICMRATRPII